MISIAKGEICAYCQGVLYEHTSNIKITRNFSIKDNIIYVNMAQKSESVPSTQCGLVTHIWSQFAHVTACVIFDFVSNHNVNLWWPIINCTLCNKLERSISLNTNVFFHGNPLEMYAVKWRTFWVGENIYMKINDISLPPTPKRKILHITYDQLIASSQVENNIHKSKVLILPFENVKCPLKLLG